MRDCFEWVPDEAKRRYAAVKTAFRGCAGNLRPAGPAEVRYACRKYDLKMHQLRRYAARQQRWDLLLRTIGRDSELRKDPEGTKAALWEQLRRCRSLPDRAEEELRKRLWYYVRHNLPTTFGYDRLPGWLRTLGQLELARRPRNRFRKVTPELAARIRALAVQEPKPGLRAIERQLRQEGFDVSYVTVRRVLKVDPGASAPHIEPPACQA